MWKQAAALSCVVAVYQHAVSAFDPQHAENITIYHVNSDSFGVAPLNMDVANLPGDAFFDLRSLVSPLECANGQHSSDCTNPEVTAKDLVITKLVLTVDNRFGSYAFCNVCVNGSAGISGSCSEDGEYVCACRHGGGGSGYFCWHGTCYPSDHSYQNQTACQSTCKRGAVPEIGEYPFVVGAEFDHTAAADGGDKSNVNAVQQPSPGGTCNNSVGYENVTQFFGGHGCRQGSPNYECWRDNVAAKMKGGIWYSTLEKGWCGDGTSPAPEGCTWQVAEVVKIVNKTCSDNAIFNTVESYDATHGTNCFKQDECMVGAARNTSSACWIGCFYSTILGPDSGTPGGAVEGMPLDDLLSAWQMPFASTDPAQGGCADLPPKPHRSKNNLLV